MSLSTFIFMRDKIFRKFSLYDDMMIYFKKLGYTFIKGLFLIYLGIDN